MNGRQHGGDQPNSEIVEVDDLTGGSTDLLPLTSRVEIRRSSCTDLSTAAIVRQSLARQAPSEKAEVSDIAR